MRDDNRYTFGDNDVALGRLGLLAEIYDPVSEELLRSFGRPGAAHAVDLGCGPGHTTRLLARVLAPALTSGLDASARYIALARASAPPGVRFEQHDVMRTPFPVPLADVLLCRYLLTHLRSADAALAAWARAANAGAVLLVQETETLASDTPVLSRYYSLVAELQARCGQAMDAGALVDAAVRRSSGWSIRISRVHSLAVDAGRMARLHLMNLETWRHDPVAAEIFDPAELDRLEQGVAAIAEGRVAAPAVRHELREIVAVRAVDRTRPTPSGDESRLPPW